MTLLDGKKISEEILRELSLRARAFEEKTGRKIGLAVVSVGDNEASAIYVRNKIRACEKAGVRSYGYRLPAGTGEEETLGLLRELAAADEIDGILVQLPLPAGYDEKRLLSAIPPAKDVDGFSAVNIGKLALKEEGGAVACTPRGVMELLRRYGVSCAGKRAVVVGRSNIVGRPMALLLLNADATVSVCHSRTADLKSECARADIIVAAAGRAKLITADMVREGAVVIDVGMNRSEGKLCGDVDFEAVAPKCSYITPVPGGVGPMTVAMLISNVCDAAERKL